MKCDNCGKKLTCPCQKKRASNGRQCCIGCIIPYEKALKEKK
jgi:hypothetical protein